MTKEISKVLIIGSGPIVIGQAAEFDDWMGAFNGDVCVGARRWGNCDGGTCDVPVLGYDGTEFTTGYMMYGGIPTFQIYDASVSQYLDAVASEDIPWSNNGLFMLESSGEIYTNTGTKDNPNWMKRVSGGGSSKIFGDGSDGDVVNPTLIGVIDATYNGLNGQPLRINLFNATI